MSTEVTTDISRTRGPSNLYSYLQYTWGKKSYLFAVFFTLSKIIDGLMV